MEFIFSDLKQSPSWARLLCAVAVISIFIIILSPIVPLAQGILALVAYTSLALFFAPPLIKAAHEDHSHLLTVCVWSFVLVILGILTAFFSFYSIFGSSNLKYDKLLNVVPVFVAIWAAGLGWLIHFKLTTKAHRTNNAFSIVMEMRKSSEVIKRQEIVSRHFPPGMTNISDEYVEFFPKDAVHKLYVAADWKITEVDQVKLEKAEAVWALKFMLNYYEFMAAGLKAGDLDKRLLEETVIVMAIGLHKRSAKFIQYTRADKPEGSGEPLAYEHLSELCCEWEKTLIRMKAEKEAA